jgi:cardiolipin synthase
MARGRASVRMRASLRRHGALRRPADLRRLLRDADLRFAPDNEVEFYSNGRSGIDAMVEAVASARKRIHFETYILRSDETGRRFIRALAERASDGVEVRVLYDGIGSLGVDDHAFDALRAAGGQVVVFHPLRRVRPDWVPWQRDHRKILVVDGETAFTGGLNVGDEYWAGTVGGDGERRPWRDAHVRITGGAVAMLEAVFFESWFRADGPDHPWRTGGLPAAAATGSQSVAVLADGPGHRTRRMRDLLIAALERAERRVQIVTPYFLPGRAVREALCATAERGVRVQLLTAGASDHPVLRWAARDLMPGLVGRGVFVYEYERAMMHAKIAVFDEHWAVLGTSNLDRQSLRRSYEVNVVAAGGKLPADLSRLVDSDVRRSRRITARHLEARPLPQWFRDRLAAAVLTRL